MTGTWCPLDAEVARRCWGGVQRLLQRFDTPKHALEHCAYGTSGQGGSRWLEAAGVLDAELRCLTLRSLAQCTAALLLPLTSGWNLWLRDGHLDMTGQPARARAAALWTRYLPMRGGARQLAKYRVPGPCWHLAGTLLSMNSAWDVQEPPRLASPRLPPTRRLCASMPPCSPGAPVTLPSSTVFLPGSSTPLLLGFCFFSFHPIHLTHLYLSPPSLLSLRLVRHPPFSFRSSYFSLVPRVCLRP